jgi:Holliday junction resolvasome RuvABC endonuclease subunit
MTTTHQSPTSIHIETTFFNKVLASLLVLVIGGAFAWYAATTRQTTSLEVRVSSLETKVDGLLTKAEHEQFKEEVMNSLHDIKQEQLYQRSMLENHMDMRKK